MLAATDNTNDGYYILRSLGRPQVRPLDVLKNFRVDSYYPMVLEMKKVPRRELSAAQRRSGIEIKKPQLSPLFPGYYFARMEQATHSWRDIMNAAGLAGMLCEGDMPVKMRPDFIAKIRAREHDGAIAGVDTLRAIFEIGDQVMVTDGPFAAFPGIVERGLDLPIEALDPQDRIKVAVNLFGRATPVELEVWQVAKQAAAH